MKNSEIYDALEALWVLVRESDPLVIGSQSLHGKYPDVADTILFSREVDVILPNKAKLGNWLVDVVGDGTPFAVDRGYYIDHVLAKEGFPVLADGWDQRSIRHPFTLSGEVRGQARFLSPEDMVISKLAAGRQKDFEFIGELVIRGYVKVEDVERLITSVPSAYREKVSSSLDTIKKTLVQVSTLSPGAINSNEPRAHGDISLFVNQGEFNGKIVDRRDVTGAVVQKVGRDPDKVVWHEFAKLSRVPDVGEVVGIKYQGGIGQVSARAVDVEKGR